MSLLIVGTLAFDSVETDAGSVNDALGGSATFGAYAASTFTSPSIVGVVGDDFPKTELAKLKRKGVDTEGVQIVEGGKTFRWGGRYLEDMNQRETLFTDLNVIADFNPVLPESYRSIQNIFLANIDPDLQLEVLKQVKDPRLVVCDTMNLWIDIKHQSLLKLLQKVDVLLVNDEEARMLTDTLSIPQAAKELRSMGIERVLIKKGEHGCLLFGPEGTFSCPALPLTKVVDPTGAGDSFAGGMLGWLAGRKLTEANWRKAIVAGTAMASFAVEDFSIDKLRRVRKDTVQKRAEEIRAMTQVGKL